MRKNHLSTSQAPQGVNGYVTLIELLGKRRPIRFRRTVFTLIELLVVIAIILILVAMLLPALERARYQANVLNCAADHKQWGVAFLSHAGDNNRNLVKANLPIVSGGNCVDVGDALFTKVADPYGIDWTMWTCSVSGPLASSRDELWNLIHYFGSGWGHMRNRGLWIPRQLPNGKWIPEAGQVDLNDYPSKLSDDNSSLKLMFACGAGGPNSGWTGSPVAGPHTFNGKLLSTNQLFLDGHVELVPTSEIQYRYHGNWGNYW